LLCQKTYSQELFKINLTGDSLYRATKDVPFVYQNGNNAVFIEYTNFTRENVSMSLDTFLSRACDKYFKITFADGRVGAVNKDFIKRVARRTGNRTYIYMLHSPNRFDLLESLTTLEQRMALCGGAFSTQYQELFLENDSLFITNGNGVPLDSMFAGSVYTAGAGIDITGNVVTNIGDTNPTDDVLKTTNHAGDVTGVYNMLEIADGVVSISKLDSLNVLNWILDNFPLIDTTDIDTSAFLTWIYNHVDTTDLDEQELYIQGDSLYITNGNGIPLDSLSQGGLPVAQRGETMWYDGSDWVPDSTIYNVGNKVGVLTDTIFAGSMTVKGDTAVTFVGASDSSWIRVLPKDDNIYIDYKTSGWTIFTDDATGSLGPSFTSRDYLGMPRGRFMLPSSMMGISGTYTHTSGERVEVQIGLDSIAGSSSAFAPVSGTGTYASMKISGTVNQTTATGISRGLWVAPLITAAHDYRAVEIGTSSGKGLVQTGSLVTNRILGKTSFGSLLTPARDIHNYGQTRLQTPVTGADGLAGIHLANGDVAHIALGTGLTLSGDTLYAAAADTNDLAGGSGIYLEGDSIHLGGVMYKEDEFVNTENRTLAIGRGIPFEEYWAGGIDTIMEGILTGGKDAWNGHGLYTYWGDSGDSVYMEVMHYPLNGDVLMTSRSPTYAAGLRLNNGRVASPRKGYVEVEGELANVAYDYLLPAVTPSNVAGDTSIAVWIGGTSLATPKFIPYDPGGSIGPGAPYYLARWGTDSVTLNHGLVYDSLNVGIATKTPVAQLDVLGDGVTNATRAFRVADSGNSTMFSIKNDGTSWFGAVSTSPSVYPITGTGLSTVTKTGTGLGFYSYASNATAFGFSGANIASTSGTATTLHVQRGFTAASGSATYNHVLLDPTINQTGGASGFSYGLRVNPTLTSAANWVSVSLENSSGIGLHQSGASVNNMINGNTHFGATTAGIRQLQVTGDLRVSGDVDTATVARLWGGNTQGDLRKLKPTGNLVISNDTLNSPHYYFTIEDATSGPGRIYSTDGIQVLATGSVTATIDTATKILTINGLGPAGSGGETNLGLNVGAGAQVYKGKTDTTLLFRTLVDAGLTTVTQQGDTIIINTPAQTLSTSNDSIYISDGNGVKVPGTIANGTTYNSTLRWNNVIWKQNDLMLADSLGHTGIGAAIQTTRSITTAKDIDVYSIRIGRGSGNSVFNTAIGNTALNTNTSGIENTVVGHSAGQNVTQNRNTMVGYRAGEVSVTSDNTFIGNRAGYLNTTGDGTAIGSYALGFTGSKTGTSNTAIGDYASGRITSASSTVAVGGSAMAYATTSGSNTAVGHFAMYNSAGSGVTFNTVVGKDAGRAGNYTASTFLGMGSGYNSTSDFSIFAGYNAGYNVTKDSTLFMDVGSDTVGTIVGDLRNNRLGINRSPWTVLRTLDVNGTARVVSNVDTATVTRLWAGNTQGDMRRVKLGTNLSISNDTLNASGGGGGGMPYDTTVVPSTKFVGINVTEDTLTDLHGDFYDYVGPLGDFYTLKNTRIQDDTVVTLRGSYFQASRKTDWDKTLAGNTDDTLRVNTNLLNYDFTNTDGSITHRIGPEEHYLVPGTSGTLKIFTLSASISLTPSAPGAVNFGIYVDGNETECATEFYLSSSTIKQTATITCITNDIGDNSVITLKLRNDESTPRTYTISRAQISGHHIKNLVIPAF